MAYDSAPLPVPGPAAELHGARVLIVEDDPVNRIVLAGLLASAGLETAEADSGERAIDLCEAFKPHLVVMDVRLPGIDGLETCRELHRRRGIDNLPVIFVTARNSQDDIVAGFDAGGVDYLVKPVSGREAMARIHAHLSNRLLVQQLEEAVAHKNRLLGMAAHDLRNPLSTIRGMTDLLRDGALGPLADEQNEIVTLVHDVSKDMLRLVNELLDISVIESGQLKLTRTHTDMGALVAKSVRFNNITAARKQTTIRFLSADQVVHAMIDAPKMAQVVDNLLTNAVKYSPAGSTVSISLKGTDNRAIIAVQDQGPGIPEQERSKLFKEFGTLSVQSTGGEKSIGLGLAICRRIVEAHAGIIDAQNLPGGGCEFSVILPASP